VYDSFLAELGYHPSIGRSSPVGRSVVLGRARIDIGAATAIARVARSRRDVATTFAIERIE